MDIVFDYLILIFLVITVIPAVILLHHCLNTKESWEYRYRRFTFGIAVFLLFGSVLIVYGSFVEPKIILINEEKIDLEKINEPIKIVLIADMQAGPYKKDNFIVRVSQKINKLNPDLILMVGDNINNSGNTDKDVDYLSGFTHLNKNIPIYAINGNHEYGVSNNVSLYMSQYRLPDLSNETKVKMESLGIKYLVNEMVKLDIKGQEFNLFGGDSYWAQKLDLKALRDKNNDLLTIALVHNPSAFYDVVGNNVDLMLSGHTHGGQIRLPFIGPLIKVSSDIPRSWHKGWVEYKNTKMFVSSGIGETGTRARLFTWPEIVVLTIY